MRPARSTLLAAAIGLAAAAGLASLVPRAPQAGALDAAHALHLRGAVAAPLACDACHAAEGSGAARARKVVFGALASAGGGRPRWDRVARSCTAVSCHGEALPGTPRPPAVWSDAARPAACGSCHGIPPPPATGHPAVDGGAKGCARCHPDTVLTDGTLDVGSGRHLNGRVDVGGAACGACHRELWDGVGTPSPRARRAGGAHALHLPADPVLRAVACGECHPIPTTLDHVDGRVALAWGSLARARSATPSFDPATRTCSGVYCHGAKLRAGGSIAAPAWTEERRNVAACGRCHGVPPPRSTGHPPVESRSAGCGRCHPGFEPDGAIEIAQGPHLNGVVDVRPLTCTSCHGDPDRAVNAPAPPRGTHGETATTALAVGAHQEHLRAGKLARAVSCDTCHRVPASIPHAKGRVELALGKLAATDGAVPQWNRLTATCSGVYCHGATLAGGVAREPRWTRVDGAQSACDACHGAPPPTGAHALKEHVAGGCGACHAGATQDAVNVETHLDGSVDLGGAGIRSYDGAARSCASACHEERTWAMPVDLTARVRGP